MCYAQIAMMAVNVGMQVMGNNKEDKAIGAEIGKLNAQKQQKVRELNYNISSLSREQVDQFDQAVTQLQGNSINSIRNQGMLEAALGETNLQGRSTDSVLREVQGQDARVADSIRDNYKRSFQGLQYAKETNILETQSSLDGMPTIKGPSAFSRTMGIINAGAEGWSMGGSWSSMAQGAGGMLGRAGYASSGQQSGGSSGGGMGGILGMFGGMFGGGGGTGANTGMGGNAGGGLKMPSFK